MAATLTRPTTPAELRKMCVLPICRAYDDEHLAVLLAEPDALATLLAIPPHDAIHVLAGVLPREQRVEWAQASALRAEKYAAAAAANYAAAAAIASVHAALAAAVSIATRATIADRATIAFHAAANAATYAASSASSASVNAALAAAHYAHDAAAGAYVVARTAEYEASIRHAVQLLGW